MNANGPWKIKSSKEAYKNPWIRVREDQVIRPDGQDGIFAVVEMVPGVSVLPLDDEGFVYLTSEFRFAVAMDSIEVVSGAIDEHESEIDAAKRELLEETGLTADEWIDLGKINPFTSVVHSPARMYVARHVHLSESNPEGTEKIQILKIKFEEALRMVMASEITHGPSSVLILKAAEYLRPKHS